jgi:hypothetical protein
MDATNVITAVLNHDPKPPATASVAQIEANRRNAQKSTGPKTDAGKQASSRNAIKYGLFSRSLLLPEEDEERYAAFCDEYIDELQPVGLAERNLVQEMIAAQWRLIRLNVVEQGAYDRARQALMGSRSNPKPAPTAIEIELETGSDSFPFKAVSRVSQWQSRLSRDYHRAAKELRILQKERKSTETSPAPDPIPSPHDSLNSSTSSNS